MRAGVRRGRRGGRPCPSGSPSWRRSHLGLLGALAGLVLGLLSPPPTAWFAVLEVGVPAALLGALAGLAVGSATWLLRRA